MPAGKAGIVAVETPRASRVEIVSARLLPIPTPPSPAPGRFTSWAIETQFGKRGANTERNYALIIRAYAHQVMLRSRFARMMDFMFELRQHRDTDLADARARLKRLCCSRRGLTFWVRVVPNHIFEESRAGTVRRHNCSP